MNFENSFSQNPLRLYGRVVLNHFSAVGTAMKQTLRQDWERFGGFLVDKFAIHSFSLFHMMSGLIGHSSSTDSQRKFSYDVFSINSVLRSLIETYVTFHLLFVNSNNESEKHFRFLLWQLDGLKDQQKFKIEKTDFTGAEQTLDANQQKIEALRDQIVTHPFYLALELLSQTKLYDRTKNKINWKFRIDEEGRVLILKIIDLIEFACKQRSFLNLYQYASMHTHSGYIAIENFEKIRGKILSKQDTDPLIRQAILLTFLLINDICAIDDNASEALKTFPDNEHSFITGMVNAIKGTRK